MDGVEIIESIVVEQVPEYVLACLILGVWLILVPTVVVLAITHNAFAAFVSEIVIGIGYIALIVILLVSGVLEQPTGEYNYKVKITEDVGYIEFTDKYDVITDNGDGTYIVAEKE